MRYASGGKGHPLPCFREIACAPRKASKPAQRPRRRRPLGRIPPKRPQYRRKREGLYPSSGGSAGFGDYVLFLRS
ncbi:hypothetical protein WCP94_001607 [Bilophila wadsworthia]